MSLSQSPPYTFSELGYLYKRAELNSGDLCSTVPSVAALLKRIGLSPLELVCGGRSLGALLEEQGHRAVPSPRQPGPGGQRYYKGGYISQTHGSSTGGQVDAIQVPHPLPPSPPTPGAGGGARRDPARGRGGGEERVCPGPGQGARRIHGPTLRTAATLLRLMSTNTF